MNIVKGSLQLPTSVFSNDINFPYFESQLKWYADYSEIYYTVADYNQTYINGSTVYIKLISTGKLEGYYQDTVYNYNYRFDFDKYIKIYNEYIIDSEYVLSIDIFPKSKLICKDIRRELYKNKDYSSLFFGLSNVNIIDITSTDKHYSTDGEIYIKITNTLPFSEKYDFVFLDTYNTSRTVEFDYSKFKPSTNNNKYFKGTWASFSIPSPVTTSYKIFTYDINNNKIQNSISYSYDPGPIDYSDSGYTIPYNGIFFLYIPDNCEYVTAEIPNVTGTTAFKIYTQCKPKNLNCFYYNNLEGSFDVLYTEGTINKIDLTSKKYLTSGNNKFTYSIDTTHQLKVNTGYKLSDLEIRSLMRSPYIYYLSISDVLYTSGFNYNVYTLKRYTLDNNTFDGYTGKKLSERNIELVLNEDKTYKRKSNFNIGFFD